MRITWFGFFLTAYPIDLPKGVLPRYTRRPHGHRFALLGRVVEVGRVVPEKPSKPHVWDVKMVAKERAPKDPEPVREEQTFRVYMNGTYRGTFRSERNTMVPPRPDPFEEARDELSRRYLDQATADTVASTNWDAPQSDSKERGEPE